MHTPTADCPLRSWHRSRGLRGPRGFHGGRDLLLQLAEAAHPDAVRAPDLASARAALAAGRAVLGLQINLADGPHRVDLLEPSADGVRLVALHGGKEPERGRARCLDQWAAAAAVGLPVAQPAVAVFTDAGPPRRGHLARWGPVDQAAAVVCALPGPPDSPPPITARAPVPDAPPDAAPSPRACRDCPVAPRCADDVPGWRLAQLASVTPDERAAWRAAGLHTPADVLAHAPPRAADAVRQLLADRDGRPVVAAGAEARLRDLPADAVALDLEGFDLPLAPWPDPHAFPRTITQVAVARQRAGLVEDVGHWLAALDHDPDREAAEALLALCPPDGPLLVWGHEDRKRIHELAARVPDRAPALRALADRLVDLQARLHVFAFPSQAGHGLKSTARAAAGVDPWSDLPADFDPAAARRLAQSHAELAPALSAALATYCLADARAVLLVLEAARRAAGLHDAT